jgi:cytochrome c553
MRHFINFSLRLLALLFVMSSVSGYAQESEKLHQRANAAMCANCHGTEGRTVKDSSVPSIAGLPRDYMVQQMQAFKNGTRPATIMHQLSKGLSDAQITSLADYFAALPR